MAEAKFNIDDSKLSNNSGTQMIGVNNNQTNYYNNFAEKNPLQLPYRFGLPDPIKNFYGRRIELENLHEMLNNSPTTVLSQAITGLGGIGKTELAKTYAKQYGEDYGIIMFVVGENPSELTNTFYTIAEKFQINITLGKGLNVDLIPIRNVVDDIYQYCSRNANTLVIIDNVEEPEDIINFLPRGSLDKIKILITSRRREWDLSDHGEVNVLNLEVLTVKESEQYIKESLKNDDLYNDEDIYRLSERLQRLPLALKQAISYIEVQNKRRKLKRKLFTLSDYLDLYDKQAEQLLEFRRTTDMYTMTVLTTWKITIEKIKTKYGDEGLHAAKLLEYISYLLPDNIPYEDIFKIDKIDVNNDAILLLYEYSMVDIDKELMKIHRLVQEVTRMEIKNREEIVVKEVLMLLKDCKYDWFTIVDQHAGAVWVFGGKYQNILNELYEIFPVPPLGLIVKQKNCDLESVKNMSLLESNLKRIDNIDYSFKICIEYLDLNIIEYLYDMWKEFGSVDVLTDLIKKAFDRKDEDIIIFLLDKILNINVKISGKTSLLRAYELKLDRVIDYISVRRHVDSQNYYGETFLMEACAFNSKDMVKMLIESEKCLLNRRNIEGQTAIFYACLKGNDDIVRLLIETEVVDLNIQDVNGDTPLTFACSSNSSNTVKAIIDSGRCDLNLKKADGRTAIFRAYEKRNVDIIRLLLQYKELDVNVQDENGDTVLMLACASNLTDIVTSLVESERCNLALKNKCDRNAVFYALRYGNDTIYRLVMDYCVKKIVQRDSFASNVQYASSDTVDQIN